MQVFSIGKNLDSDMPNSRWDIWKNITIVGSGSDCVHFYGIELASVLGKYMYVSFESFNVRLTPPLQWIYPFLMI